MRHASPPPPPPPHPRSDIKGSKPSQDKDMAAINPAKTHVPLVSVINTAPARVSSDGVMTPSQAMPHPPTHVPISAVPGYLTPVTVYQRAPIHLGSGVGGQGGLPPLSSRGEIHRMHRSPLDAIGHHNVGLKTDENGLPKLNARQRRTLRRAKDRCIAGIVDAGLILLKMQGDMSQDHDRVQGTDADGSEDGREDERVDKSDMYLAAALKVARGEIGAEAAYSAREILKRVSEDLHDTTLTHLMSGLVVVDKPTDSIDRVLVRDLMTIRKISAAVNVGLASIAGVQPEN